MKEPIKANTKLRCAIRCHRIPAFRTDGFTRELARDHAVIDADVETYLPWLQPGREVTLAIELPPFRQQAPRVLLCRAAVGGLRFVDGYWRLDLEIESMAVANRKAALVE
jgi:hypothetical protein